MTERLHFHLASVQLLSYGVIFFLIGRICNGCRMWLRGSHSALPMLRLKYKLWLWRPILSMSFPMIPSPWRLSWNDISSFSSNFGRNWRLLRSHAGSFDLFDRGLEFEVSRLGNIEHELRRVSKWVPIFLRSIQILSQKMAFYCLYCSQSPRRSFRPWSQLHIYVTKTIAWELSRTTKLQQQ